MEFAKISSIDVENRLTWSNKIYLTFDIDWAHDDVLNDTIDLVEESGAEATWFVTHNTPMLDRLRANPKFELGIHPNFNFLLKKDGRNGHDDIEVVNRLKEILPDATAVRSHSMLQSTVLLDLFRKAGLTHDANHFIPAHKNIEIKPWLLWNGIVRVPYGWEDDIFCMYGLQSDMSEFIYRSDLKVFDFHPIHVFLNTESLNRYENTRSSHQKPRELIDNRYEGYGTRNRLLELLKLNNVS